jgi:uncharacterized protein YkwD
MMDELSDLSARAVVAPHRLVTRGVKVAIAIGVVVVLAAATGGAYAYSDHAAQQTAAAEHAAAAQLTAARMRLNLAEDSAVRLQSALTAVGTAANGVADPKTVTALTAALAVLKNETDKPAFPTSAPLAALNDRAVDLDVAVDAALAAVPAVGASVHAVDTTRLASASSASAASASAAKSALAALNRFLTHHDDPRGLIIPVITTVKAAQASSDAAAAAAQAAAARATHHSYSAAAGAPVCASDVLTCVNQIRAFYGIGPLHSNGTLNTAAQACAERMAASGSMTHSAYPGGWNSWGENIAEGYGSSVSVFNAWMASPGHRANILDASYTQTGIGHVAAGSWWCEQFGG